MRSLLRTWSTIAGALSILGCGEPRVGTVSPTAAPSVASGAVAESAPLVAPRGPLGVATFIEDDFARAEAQARAEGKLLFVDVWAPWCHTCLAMQNGVFDAPALGALGASYVFASLDGDREENAAFVGAHPLRVWPTFFVLDPTTKAIVALYGGSLSLAELEKFLDDAYAARSGASAAAFANEAKALAEAHAAFAAKDYARAAERYAEAAATPWPRRTEALLGGMYALSSAKQFPRCGSFGTKHLGDVKGASSEADFVAILRACAEKSTDIGARKAIFDATLARLRALAATPPEGSSVDDRADLLDMLASAELASNDQAAARRTHEKRLALLEEAAKAAGSPEAARVFDYARMGSLFALDRGPEAEALFLGRVKEFPESYEAWARLASSQLNLGKNKEALASIDKAIGFSYGPRRLRYMVVKAEIQTALGDLAGARATIEAEVAGQETLPKGQFDPAKVDEAKARLQLALDAERSSLPTPGAPPKKPAP